MIAFRLCRSADYTEFKTPLEQQFDDLLNTYQSKVRYANGLGIQGQHIVDEPWNAMERFLKEHPECNRRLPAEKEMLFDHNPAKDFSAAIDCAVL